MHATLDTNTPSMEASNPPVVRDKMPPPVVAPTPAPEPATTEYVVVKGDTLGKIAKKNGVTLKALGRCKSRSRSNQIESRTKTFDSRRVGQRGCDFGNWCFNSSDMSGTETIYTVKSGDTLTKIARAHGVTVKALESENGLSTTKIKVGQKLKIPAKAESATPAPEPTPAPAAPAVAPTTTTAPSGQ